MGTKLFRAVDKAHMEEISATGTRPWTYWTSLREMAAYYEECLDDEDKEAVVLVVDTDDIDMQGLEPDRPSVDEPITTVLGMSEDEVQKEWHKTDGSWEACLHLVKSVKYALPIPASALRMLEFCGLDENEVPLPEAPYPNTL